VRRFSQDYLRPNEHRLEEEGEVPEDIVQSIRDIGLFGVCLFLFLAIFVILLILGLFAGRGV
jgi:hypothetical protein